MSMRQVRPERMAASSVALAANQKCVSAFKSACLLSKAASLLFQERFCTSSSLRVHFVKRAFAYFVKNAGLCRQDGVEQTEAKRDALLTAAQLMATTRNMGELFSAIMMHAKAILEASRLHAKRRARTHELSFLISLH
eukprot:5295124-Pleurochrysis_carterae.AAC.8